VGGIVNLVTNRVHSDFEKGFYGRVLSQGETVNNGISSGTSLDYGKKNWMFHVDGSTRNLQNQKIPGYARSSYLRSSAPETSEPKNKLPNSFNQQVNIGTGVSKIFDKGYVGLSFNHFNSNYGTVAEEEVSIDMIQNRFELHSEYRPESSLFSKVKLKSAQSDYLHKEMENGVTGTQFKNSGNETRLEALNKKGDMEGDTGIQTQMFKFSAEGEEAFLPTTNTQKAALFTYQELRKNQTAFSFGTRVESSKMEKKSSSNFGASEKKNFETWNGSFGYQYKFNDHHSLSTNFSYTERAPNFQELYAKGPHLATGTYEQGMKGLNREKAYALELSLKKDTTNHKINFNIYSQIFNDFIYLNPTGEIEDSLPEYEYDQANALFYGADVENKNQWNLFNFITKLDFVRAKNTNDGHNLPRISPPRASFSIEYVKDRWMTDLELQYVFSQGKTAPGEKSTDEYTLTNIGCTYEITTNQYGVSIFSRIRNIFDVTARNHVSTLKEIAPLPGRNFILGAQVQI
jgi:iron complex outermembrane receptor protein